MKSKFFWILFFVILFILYASGEEKNIRTRLNKLGDDENTTFTNIYLKNNRKKKKNIKISKNFNHSSEKELNKRSKNFKNEDISLLDLLKKTTFINLKDYNINKTPIHFEELNKDKIYLSKYNFIKKNKDLNNIINFIQNNESELSVENDLDKFSQLNRKVNFNSSNVESFKLRLEYYIDYAKLAKSFKDNDSHFKTNCLAGIQKSTDFINEALKFYKDFKEMIKPPLEGNRNKSSPSSRNSLELEGNIEEKEKKIDSYYSDSRLKCNNDYICILNHYSVSRRKYSSEVLLEEIDTVFSNFFCSKYYKFVKDNSNLYKQDEINLGHIENFLTFSKKVLRFDENQIYQNQNMIDKKWKEYIIDIEQNKEIYKDNISMFNKYHQSLVNDEKTYGNCAKKLSAQKNNIGEKLRMQLNYMLSYYDIKFLDEKNKELRKKLHEEIKKFTQVTKDIEEELKLKMEEKVNSLLHPKNLDSEMKNIISDSQRTLNDVDNIIEENSVISQNSSKNYQNSIFIDTKGKLNKDVAEIIIHSDNIKRIFSSMNDINNNINSLKTDIMNIKNKELSSHIDRKAAIEDLLNRIISIEKQINLIKEKFDMLENYHKELKSLKDEITKLKIKVQENYKKLQEIKKEYDKSKEEIIEQIKQKLSEISESIINLKKIKSLSETENEDLKITGNLINEASCDMSEYKKKETTLSHQFNVAQESLRSTIDNEMLRIISQFTEEKKKLNYMEYELTDLDKILKEVIENYSRINSINANTENILQNNMNPVLEDIVRLKKDTTIKLIDDLYHNIGNSFKSFKEISHEISEEITIYNSKDETLKRHENYIEIKKNQFFSNLFEDEDNELLGKNNLGELKDLQNEISNEKNEITKKINNEEDLIKILKKYLNSYNKVEEFFKILNDFQTFKELKVLKEPIDKINLDDVLNGHKVSFQNINESIDNSTGKIHILNKKVDAFKILNNCINGSHKNDKSIENLKKEVNTSKGKITTESIKVNEDNSLEESETNNTLDQLKGKEKEIDGIIAKISELEEKSSNLLLFYEDIKKNVDEVKIIDELGVYIENTQGKKNELTDITRKIHEFNLKNIELDGNIDTIINNHNDSIQKLCYLRIMKLEKDADGQVQTNLNTLDETEENFKNYDEEIYTKKIKNDNNKQSVNNLAQYIKNIIKNINIHREKVINTKKKYKEQVGKANEQRKNSENSYIQKKRMIEVYNEMKKILEELDVIEKEINLSVKDVNTKKLEYNQTLINAFSEQINDEKEKAEEEVNTINVLKSKIEELKKNTAEHSESELKSFKYETYVNNAKENEDHIKELQLQANKLKEEINNGNKILVDTENILKRIEEILDEVIKRRNDIRISLDEIANVEKLLMTQKLKAIMDYLRDNMKKVEEENVKAKSELAKSEEAKNRVLMYFQRAEKLKDLIGSSSEEDVMLANINEIKTLKDDIINIINNMDIFSTESAKCKENSSTYYNNIVRGKEKIIYLKRYNKSNEKEITTELINELNKNIEQSSFYLKEADTSASESNKNCQLTSEYKAKINSILNETLILVEKVKYKKIESDTTKLVSDIKSHYSNIIESLENSIEKINNLKEQIDEIKEKDDKTNEKSLNAFVELEKIKNNINTYILEINSMKTNADNVFNYIEGVSHSILEISGRSEDEGVLDELKKEQDNLKRISEIFEEVKNRKKNLLQIEEKMSREIENIIYNIESNLEKFKKLYVEGIIEDIKREADQEKVNVESLKNSLISAIDVFISFFNKHGLEQNKIIQELGDYKDMVIQIHDKFEKSYKKLVDLVESIMLPSTTYDEAKSKKEEVIKEQEKYKKEKDEIIRILNDVNNIKKSETLKFISGRNLEIKKVYEKYKEQQLKVEEYIEEIKKIYRNIINSSDEITNALNDLDQAKNKFSEINGIKIECISYKNKVDPIYMNIVEGKEFMDMNEESEGFQILNDSKNIMDNIKEIEEYISNKENEGKNLIIESEDIIEKFKFRIKLREKISESKKKVDYIFTIAQNALEKCKKIEELNTDDQNYYEIVKDEKQYINLRESIDSYKIQNDQIKNELKKDLTEINSNDIKNNLINLEKVIDESKNYEYDSAALKKAENDIAEIVDWLDDKYNNVIKKNALVNHLIELDKKDKFSLLDLFITTMDIEISKDMLLIQKIKKDSEEVIKYIKNIHVIITSDMDKLSEFIDSNIIIYSPNNIDMNQYEEFFKIKEQESMKIISDMRTAFLSINEKINVNIVIKNLHLSNDLYKKLKIEKKSINDKYKNLSDIKLKEMEKKSKIYLDIAQLLENFLGNQKQKLIENSDNLKNIQYFFEEKKQILTIELTDIDTSIHLVSAIYATLQHKIDKKIGIENDNNIEYKKLTKYTENIPHLIKRVQDLSRDINFIKCENNSVLLKEENKKLSEEIHHYVSRIDKNVRESNEHFESIQEKIKKNMDIISENKNMTLVIDDVIQHITDIKEKIQSEKDNKKSKEKKFPNDKYKIAGGVLSSLFLCSCVFFTMLHKNNYEESDNNEENLEFEECENEISNLDEKEEIVDVSFVEGEDL
ncbi:reticulocyte binding protein, putative [Plasmodium gallinaceum]|uniref:Reticulocyte binding protein, putative n=1 Tax=Plasmodium gallinaceum TaxID=5849 RepID=A0A1J1GSQ5_PLAGA|nr:reticulocyte binding protein, putative [Plasmodium gallinaceum]CRG95523.1 reticulocyte binding protein, putative [Plasmodium gallinaceum]